MVWLLPLSLFFSQVQVYELKTPYELRRQLRQEACARAEAIARRGPCTDSDDCPAYNEWRFMMGVPGLELLDPELAEAWMIAQGGKAGIRGRSGDRPRARAPRDRTFVCPAGAPR